MVAAKQRDGSEHQVVEGQAFKLFLVPRLLKFNMSDSKLDLWTSVFPPLILTATATKQDGDKMKQTIYIRVITIYVKQADPSLWFPKVSPDPGCSYELGGAADRVSNRTWICEVLEAWEVCSFAARRKARWEIINGGQGPSYCFAHCYSDSSHCIATWLIELLFANGHSVAAPVLIWRALGPLGPWWGWASY